MRSVKVWDSRLAHAGVFRNVQLVGGVHELRWSVTGQDGHRGSGAFATLPVHRLNLQQILLTGRQRLSCGPDLPRASVHLEALCTTCSAHDSSGLNFKFSICFLMQTESGSKTEPCGTPQVVWKALHSGKYSHHGSRVGLTTAGSPQRK